MTAPDLAAIADLRSRLWLAGYRPVPLLGPDHPNPKEAGKKPLGNGWPEDARRDPPFCVGKPPVSHAPNTGILCDGLRALDLDIDDRDAAVAVQSLAVEMLGSAPIRCRGNSPRCLLVYRAAEGEPPKRVLAGRLGKIEILGRGQQFAAYGWHVTGAELRWLPQGLTEWRRDDLPAVTEDQIGAFLTTVATFIEADPPAHANGHDPHAAHGEATADPLDIAAALACIGNSGAPDWEFWNRIGMAAWAASGGTQEGFAAWCAWSSRNPVHDIEQCQERWRHYPSSPPSSIGAGTLFHLAREARPDWRKPSAHAKASEPPPEDDDYGAKRSEAPKAERAEKKTPLRIINPADLEGVPVPERLWIVADWLPVGCVTGQYGDGGAGKGMSAQQLQTACATGTAWLGMAVMRCPSLGFYSEDDEDELHRRQERICRAFGLRMANLAEMRWISGVGQDNTLCTFDATGRMHVADRYYEIKAAAKAHDSKLIVLDNAADLYGGDENNRGQVRRFIGLLNKLGMECAAGVLLNCHPSRSGLASGNLDGGSTAWNNSMRSRWALARTKEEDGRDSGDRTLTRAKANYAPDCGEIRLRWAGGVLVPVTRDGGNVAMTARAAAEETFLLLLDRCEAQGTSISDSPNAGNYAPKVFARRPDREGYAAREFERAMHALFSAQRIRMTDYTVKGRARRRLVREPTLQAAA